MVCYTRRQSHTGHPGAERTMRELTIDGDHLSLEEVVEVAHAGPSDLRVSLSEHALAKVERARQAVEQAVAEGEIVYGITTGFGAFKNRIISPDQTRQLQRNIIM